jgi:hypothetical protein
MFLTRSLEALSALFHLFLRGWGVGGFVLSLFLPFLCRFLESLLVVVVECGESFKVTDGCIGEREMFRRVLISGRKGVGCGVE